MVLVTHSDWAHALNKRVNGTKWKCEVIAHRHWKGDSCGWLFRLNERHFWIELFWIRYANLTLFYRISLEYFEETNFSYSNDNSMHSAFRIVSVFLSIRMTAISRLNQFVFLEKPSIVSITYTGSRADIEHRNTVTENSIVSKCEISVCAHDQRCHPWIIFIIYNNHCV